MFNTGATPNYNHPNVVPPMHFNITPPTKFDPPRIFYGVLEYDHDDMSKNKYGFIVAYNDNVSGIDTGLQAHDVDMLDTMCELLNLAVPDEYKRLLAMNFLMLYQRMIEGKLAD